MKIFYHLYELTGQQAGNFKIRNGALIRLIFSDGKIGYADLHPWPELGDNSLNEQLASLKEGKDLSAQTQKTIHFATCDAEARAIQKNLFEGLKIPQSHYLAVDLNGFELQHALKEGFAQIKIKAGRHLEKEIQSLRQIFASLQRQDCKVRIDFNEQLTWESFIYFLREMEACKDQIEFIEDPFPYDPTLWQQIQHIYKVNLACDRQSQKAIFFPESAAYIVHKPALQAEEPFNALSSAQKMVVTSYLDHPLGQMSAAYAAARMAQKYPDKISACGLLSHFAYMPNPFSEYLKSQGPFLNPPEGFGLGFDALLSELPWKKLQ